MVSKIELAIRNFFLKPTNGAPLAVLRVGISSVLLIQGFWIANNFVSLYTPTGFLQEGLNQYFTFSLGYSTLVHKFFKWFGNIEVTPVQAFRGLFFVYIVSLVHLLVGLRTRLFSILALLCHFLLLTTGYFASYGMDRFCQIGLFYLSVFPCGEAFSVEAGWNRITERKNSFNTLGLRVLQLHLCIAYLATGVEKSLGHEWHNGEAIWRSLMLPHFRQFDFSWLSSMPWIAKLAGWGTLVVEAGYPFLIWSRRTRGIWLAAIIGLHLGISVFMGLVSFGLTMIVLNVAAFGFAKLGTSGSVAAQPPRQVTLGL